MQESIESEEKEVGGRKCGVVTPFILYPNGENVTCRVGILNNEGNQWSPAEEQFKVMFKYSNFFVSL